MHSQFQSFLFGTKNNDLPSSLTAQFAAYGKENAHKVVKYLKAVLKEKKNLPTVKLQALKVIDGLVASRNGFLLEYCGKKLYNRFRIFAEFRKEVRDERRGSLLFKASTRSQQEASEEFLIMLLGCIRKWAEWFPVDAKGKVSEFRKLFVYLVGKGVGFPRDSEEEELRKVLAEVRKSVRVMMDGIQGGCEIERVKRIGKSIKGYNKMIKNQIGKYMEMEDHELIQELNSTIKILLDGKNAYKVWKGSKRRLSLLDSPSFVLPSSCLYLQDICPKLLPEPDLLSQSILEISSTENLNETVLNETEGDNDKDAISTNEWIGLGADYCRLKDQLDLALQSLDKHHKEIADLKGLYLEERKDRETFQTEFENLTVRFSKKDQECDFLHEKLEKFVLESKDSRENHQSLEDTVKELQEKNDLLQSEIKDKDAMFRKIEESNKTLQDVCKSLEEQLEKSQNYQKILKKEIKELHLKLNKVKPVNDNSPSTFENLEDITKSLRFSIIQPLEVVMLTEEAESPLGSDDNLNEITPGGFISSRKLPESVPVVANIKNFLYLIRKRQGLLYEDDVLELTCCLTISAPQGYCKLQIKNKSLFEILGLKTKLFSDQIENLVIKIDSVSSETLAPLAQTQRILKFDCKSVFDQVPLLSVSYVVDEHKHKYFLNLPIVYTLLCSQSLMNLTDEWEAIEDFTESNVKTRLSSVKKVLRNLNFSRNFSSAYIEGNGVIVASESPVGPVLAVCILKNSNLAVYVKAKNLKLRNLINSMIIDQVYNNDIIPNPT